MVNPDELIQKRYGQTSTHTTRTETKIETIGKDKDGSWKKEAMEGYTPSGVLKRVFGGGGGSHHNSSSSSSKTGNNTSTTAQSTSSLSTLPAYLRPPPTSQHSSTSTSSSLLSVHSTPARLGTTSDTSCTKSNKKMNSLAIDPHPIIGSSSSSSNHESSNTDNHNNANEHAVMLPILIIPGIASSGLYVQESSVDDRYKNKRVWMNAGFLAESRLHNKVLNKEEIELYNKNKNNPKHNNNNTAHYTKHHPPKTKNNINHNKAPYVTVDKGNKTENLRASLVHYTLGTMDVAKRNTLDVAKIKIDEAKNKATAAKNKMMMEGNNNDNDDNNNYYYDDDPNNSSFQIEEDLAAVKNAWIQHVALDKDMIHERPGNKIRAYEGMKGCEWLVDDVIGKTQGWVWAPMIKYCTEVLGYEREVNIDAAPYDWRLAPSMTEIRDQYLTKTLARIEQLSNENNALPIVLCCHSMGCKMGHYLLNYAKQQKGQAWIDQYIHTYMAIGAPHGGVALSIRTGVTGSGLNDIVDGLVGKNTSDGLTMYRSWSSGNWLMPRYLPPHIFPPVIVRKEGELGITILNNHMIDVTSLFQHRDKPPKELRLTIVFRNKIKAHTDFYRVETVTTHTTGTAAGNNNESQLVVGNRTSCPVWLGQKKLETTRTVSFPESFYLAVPELGTDGDDPTIGTIMLYLEEPAGRMIHIAKSTDLGKKFRQATNKNPLLRGMKKKVSRLYREVAKKIDMVLRVASNQSPILLTVSDFDTGPLETTIELIDLIAGEEEDEEGKNNHSKHKQQYLVEDSFSNSVSDNDNDGKDDGETEDRSRSRSEVPASMGTISLKISYCPPPTPMASTESTPSIRAPIAITNKETPRPPILSAPHKGNTIHHEQIHYEVWSGTDIFENDGFVDPMFDMVEEYYENDPIGPITKSAMDAPPPVQCVRSIYGVNVPTEVGAIYKKVPVVTIGDNIADARYMVDESATFPSTASLLYEEKYRNKNNSHSHDWSKQNLNSYDIQNGIISETPKTKQHVPGQQEQRQICGDGTVPYWNMVHALSWKDDVKILTVDELDGAVHRDIIADERFFALLKRYCTIIDPRKNAMLLMKSNNTTTTNSPTRRSPPNNKSKNNHNTDNTSTHSRGGGGIGALSTMSLHSHSSKGSNSRISSSSSSIPGTGTGGGIPSYYRSK